MRNKLKKIALHLLVWSIILSINLSLFGGYFGHDVEMYKLFVMINAPVWLIYMILFYSNYLVFIPKLLFAGNIAAYFFCAFATLCLSYVGVQEFKASDVADKIQQSMPKIVLSEHRAALTKRDSIDVTIYGKSPLMSSIIPHADTVRRGDFLLIEDVLHSEGTKRGVYGDVVYFLNKDIGVRSIKRFRYKDIYNFRTPRNITQIYLLLLIFAISLVVGAIEKSVQRSRDLERIYREKISSELSFLKQQINPHFLFNSLNSIYSLVLPHSDQASDAVIKLSSILRYMLYESDKPHVSLDKEMEVIKDYLALQKFKFSDVTSVTMRIAGSLTGHMIEPLLLMTFIENAFKYGADNITPSFIDIHVTVEGGYFIMSVRNKIVITENKSENSGIGIKNIKRRLDLIYQDDYTLDIKSENDVFSVKLKLKLL